MARTVQLTGSTLTLSWKSTNVSDATLTVTDPNGDTSTPTVDDTSSPTHTAPLSPTLVGRHELLWVTADGESYADVLDVWPTNPRYLVSVADLIDRLGLGATFSEKPELRDALQLYIATATFIIEGVTGPLIPDTKTYRLSGDSRKRAIVLPHVSVAVTSVKVDGTALAASAYTLDPDAGIIYSDSLTDGDVNIVVVYTVGNVIIPPAARQACIEVVAHLWALSRYGNRDIEEDVVTTPMGFALPRRAWEMVQGISSAAGIA